MPNLLVRPGWLLRLEGAAVATACILGYIRLGKPGWLFAALLLVPDVGMVGYAAGRTVGAAVYNLFHISVGPLSLLAFGALSTNTMLVAVALIWLAHLGLDRMLGFGLKYPTHFKDTHFARV